MIAAILVLAAGCQTAPAAGESQEPMSPSPEGTMSAAAEEPVSAQPSTQAAAYTDISVEDAKKLIDLTPDIVIIDVSPYYDDGHLPGAVSYYLGDGSLDEAIPMLDKTKTYLVYCHGDEPSIAGATKLVEAGFAMVYRLEGNYGAWVAAGYPVEK
jgi:rhodanese-related sulfurtransferase